ncbi:MAG: hypothetical protein CVV64_03820 [Candidatus Wallbacteria bacterium HGW-Wallbacteria-1]|jgi:flagellar basal-body rod protein FlgG|uniref:Uncharacterized protein n=1 Tax=Candidatus Wallbacteria bacterium HGW-Wallbacteria-1 TaxID=2013854 RepID=A0A2N1PTX3_9BACT|nr:MAG: hypothetical protein CVV64_03820 [Candidatus Wallbacteria bacterium HGW-Wallbacteria-1]
MLRGLYSSTGGMISEMYRTDCIANDLANVDTTGYKRTEATFTAYPRDMYNRIKDAMEQIGPMPIPRPTPIGVMGTGVMVNDTITIFEQGRLEKTDNSTDMALNGEGFFTLVNDKGEARLSRNGSFTMDGTGTLVDHNGWRLASIPSGAVLPETTPLIDGAGKLAVQAAPLKLDPMTPFTVTGEGMVMQEGTLVGRIAISRVDRPGTLIRVGHNQYDLGQNSAFQTTQTGISQGYLEGSNVNPVKALVNLISAQRAYEANQKSIVSQDESLARLLAIPK